MGLGNNKLVKTGGLSGALAKKNTGVAKTFNGVGPARSNSKVVSEIAERQRMRETDNRIAFVIDATGSRAHSWKEAQKIQADMLRKYGGKEGISEIGVVCHRGQRVQNLGWFSDGAQAARAMSEISCEMGWTRIVGSLDSAMQINQETDKPPAAIILIGDCCEESIEDIKSAGQRISEYETKVYAFLDTRDHHDMDGERAFKLIAEMTGGSFVSFGDDLDIGDLCNAAAMATADPTAFDALVKAGNKAALALAAGRGHKALNASSNYGYLHS